MIQRIQSVYLFFVFCLMATLVFIPLLSSSPFFRGFNVGLFSATAVIAIVTVFLYKNRRLQIGLCYSMLAIQVLAYALFFIFDWKSQSLAAFCQYIRFSVSFIFPLIACILLCLAIKRIKKDEKLVRSLDRLR